MIEKSSFQHYKYELAVLSISMTKNTVTSSGFDKKCQVWSISKKQKLYSIKHKESIHQVHLLSDQNLDFDLITASWDKKVKLWRQGKVFKTLKHSEGCRSFDLDKENRLLAVATKDGVTLWRLDRYEKIAEEKIGETKDVKFNKTATKIIAASHDGAVYSISLQ